jgi:hypothetical protein
MCDTSVRLGGGRTLFGKNSIDAGLAKLEV